jgi:hypothetical protein
MSDVPSNLIPTRVTQLPLAPVADENSLMMIVYQGNNYQIRVGDLLSVSGVPVTRQIIAGTGMAGGGALSSNVTLNIAPGGVGNAELSNTGVVNGTYGTASQIPVFLVNAQGRVTSATQVPVVANAATLTGILSTDHGGTSKSMTLANGGIVWSGIDGLYVGPVGAAGQVLVSGGAASYTWGSLELEVPVPANTIRSGPVSGSDAIPEFRAMVNADLPASGVSANTYGSGTAIPVITVNAKGVVTNATTSSVTPAAVPNAVTFSATGGAAPGATFDGSAAKTIDYSTVGAAPAGSYLTGVIADAPLSGAGTAGSHLVHSTSDGDLHVPATSTTHNGQVLTAGATAGALSWQTPTVGTVTSVAALTLGTTGTDLSSTVANGSTTPVITLNVPTASAANRGALSAANWSTFNGKQDALVSGTNIKTINTNTVLGAGNLTVSVINWLGAYSGATLYLPNDAVSYGGSSYICILATGGGVVPTNITYWNPLAVMGNPGVSGISGGYNLPFTNASGTTIVANHNFNAYPIVQVYDESGAVIIPLSVTYTDANNVTIVLSAAIPSGTGHIICSIGGVSTAVTTQSSNYTLLPSDNMVLVTAACTIKLPVATGLQGKTYSIKDMATSGLQVIVDGNGGTIDNEPTKTMIAQYTTMVVFTDGTNWFII